MASSNFLSRAKANRIATGLSEYHLLKIVPKEKLNPFLKIKSVSGQQYNILEAASLNLQRKLTEYIITPSTAIATNLLSGAGYVTFRLNPISMITHGLQLDLTLLNNDTGAIQFAPAPFIIDRYEVFSSGSSSPMNTIRGDQIYMDICKYYSTEQLSSASSQLNIDPTNFGPNAGTIAQNASVTYSFPILGSMFRQKLFIGTIQPLDIRIYFRGTSCLVTGNTAQVTDIKLRLHGEELGPEDAEYMIQQFKKESHTYRVIHTLQRQISQAFVPNTTYTIQLSGMNGLCAEAVLSFRSSVTGSGLYTFAAPSSIEFLDNSGVSLSNSQAIDTTYLTRTVSARHYPSNFSAATNRTVLYVPYVERPYQLVLDTAFNAGFETYFDNQVRIASGSLNATYYVDVFLKVYALLTIDANGNMHIEYS